MCHDGHRELGILHVPSSIPTADARLEEAQEKPTEYMNGCGSEWQIKELELPESPVYILRLYHSSVHPPSRSACVGYTLPGRHLDQDGYQNESDIAPAVLG